jgi:hypothetical protein
MNGAAVGTLGWRSLRPREWQVLRGVGDGQVARNPLYGDLAPWVLGARSVSWPLARLVLRGLVTIDAFGLGPPRLTKRGLEALNGCD